MLVAGVPTAASASVKPDPLAAPSAQPAAGSRPVSGRNPSAGPQFKKSGTTWRVIAPEVILRNTVTDADGDKANVTFEVYTANADGTPGTKVKLTDANTYGVLVSPFVASGSTAQVQVEYGRLKPRTD